MTDIQFNSTGFDLISRIIDRADDFSPGRFRRIDLMMDLQAANGVNGNASLNLSRLLAASDADFVHDVFGIARHMDRSTGKLGDCFVPRHAVASVEA